MSLNRQESASADNIDRPQSRSQSLDGTRSGDSSRSHRESLLLSDEQYIVDYLGNSSGSDDEMSIEAKRVTRRKKLEREKLQKLGSFTTSHQNSENFRSRDHVINHKRKAYSVGYRNRNRDDQFSRVK